MSRSALATGAQVKVLINAQPFGRVAELSFNEATPQKEIRGIDTYLPSELVETAVNLNGSMTIYRMHNDGGLPAVGMQAHWADLTRQKYWSILIIDRTTDTTIFRADRCKTTSQSWGFRRGHVLGTIGFTVMQWESEIPAQGV